VDNSGVMRQAALAGDEHTTSELLERSSELSALAECLETVRRSSQGRVVFVSGEAGVGKTALLGRFCEESGQSARILWGGCDPLFTPRPLGPLLAVAEGAGGELGEVGASEVMPHEVAAALVRGLRARAAELPGAHSVRRLSHLAASGESRRAGEHLR